jgi:hypothetical protein
MLLLYMGIQIDVVHVRSSGVGGAWAGSDDGFVGLLLF